MEHLCILLVLSIGIMGCLTPYATGPGVIIYGCGYVKSKDYWRLGAIFGVIYISMLLLVGWPILACGANHFGSHLMKMMPVS
jgi:citrate:succinate antiporter